MDLARITTFIDDFRYAVQTGGGKFPLFPMSATSNETIMRKIVRYTVDCLMLLLVCTAFYAVYYILFKGYPRLVIDLLTLNFNNMSDMDQMISRNAVLNDNFTFLVSHTVPSSLAAINGSVSDVNQSALAADSDIKDLYGAWKYEQRYHEAFREYYMYFDTIGDISSKRFNMLEKVVTVKHCAFYELLTQFLIQTGKLDAGQSSNEQLVCQVYGDDLKKGSPNFNRVSAMHNSLVALAQRCRDLHAPELSFVVLPNVGPSSVGVATDFTRLVKSMTEAFYSDAPRQADIDEYTWYLLEVEFAVRFTVSEVFSLLAAAALSFAISSNQVPCIVTVMNLPLSQRAAAAARMPDISEQVDAGILDFIAKHPLFSRIFFTHGQPGHPGQPGQPGHPGQPGQPGQPVQPVKLYEQIVSWYSTLLGPTDRPMPERMSDLRNYGSMVKSVVTSAKVVDMFLNTYQKQATKNLDDQFTSNENFLKKLCAPYIEMIWTNRIYVNFRRIFSSAYFKGALWTDFHRLFKLFGDQLHNIMIHIWTTLFVSTPVNHPQPESE